MLTLSGASHPLSPAYLSEAGKQGALWSRIGVTIPSDQLERLRTSPDV